MIDDEDEIVEECLEHDISGEIHVSSSHNSLDMTTEDFKQFSAINALKQMLAIKIMMLRWNQ